MEEFHDTTAERLAAIGAAVALRRALDEAEHALDLFIQGEQDLAHRDRTLRAVGRTLDAIVIFKEYVKA
jgi:hypothetical protein